LALMQVRERGLHRLGVAVAVVGPEALREILGSLNLRSLDGERNLDTLKKIVLAVE
jgi:hypothetical protein